MRIVSVFSHGLPSRLLYHLVGINLQPAGERLDLSPHIQTLLEANLLVSDAQGAEYLVQPRIRPHLFPLLSPAERRNWYSAAGEHYYEQGDYLEAGRHLYLAGNHEAAARLLLEYEQSINEAFEMAELSQLLAESQPADLKDANLWANLKIKAGQVAEFLGQIEQALNEYRQALAAPDLYLRARAYYLRGQTFKFKSIDEALVHFEYGLRLLTTSAPAEAHFTTLLIKFYLGQGRIYIEERQDLAKAEANLRQVEALIRPDDRENEAELRFSRGLCFGGRYRPDQTIFRRRPVVGGEVRVDSHAA